MRKLTVKNFSVIKDAELEFGKITVLIGPQSSGKSLVCKLAYFFQKVVIEVAEDSMRDAEDLNLFRSRAASQFSGEWFPSFGLEKGASIKYSDGPYWFTLSRDSSAGFSGVGLEFSLEIAECYMRTFSELKRDGTNADFKYYGQQIAAQLRDIQSRDSEVYSYIPSNRSFFVTVQKAVLASSNRIDPLAIRFSQDFSYDFERRVPPFLDNYNLKRWINEESRRILKGEVVTSGNREVFVADDERQIPLSYLSSGTQELLPLFTCIREFVALSSAVSSKLDLQEAVHKRLFFVEEPEANIFPSSQYDLVRIFARMSTEPTLDASWVITTHSPYLLSSFNNLIEAGQVVRDHPELRNEVAKIIPEQYWIKNGDFKAYSIEDEKLVPILNESGFIEGNYLDKVSEVIGSEFDQLLRLEYDHTHAS